MSWQACDWADSLPFDLCKPLPFRVLVKLANVAAQDGTRAYRDKSGMARELGVHEQSIRRALRELEADHLIFAGDQRAVEHIPKNRRPKVYDLNFGYSREFAQPELPTPFDYGDDAETPTDLGDTELSTGAPGGTSGATPTVHQGTKEQFYQDLEIETYVPERAQARKTWEPAPADLIPSTLRQCGGRRRAHQWAGRYCAICEVRAEDGALPDVNGEYPPALVHA